MPIETVTDSKHSGDSDVQCRCWQNSNDRSGASFNSPCSSPHCVYAYINTGQLSFEQFKIQLGNVNKFVSIKVRNNVIIICLQIMKSFLKSMGLDTSKIKPVGRGFFFVNFR